MKKILLFSPIIVSLFACQKNKQEVNSNNLQGIYEVDFPSSFLNKEELLEGEKLSKALVSMLLSQMKMTLSFEKDSLKIDCPNITKDLVRLFVKDIDQRMPLSLEYQIKNDSVLYAKLNKDSLQKIGILKKISGAFDSLQLFTMEENPVALLLKKQKDR